ncbi:uroporphyrinogen-III synthase-like isoform X4 [Acropora muricata]
MVLTSQRAVEAMERCVNDLISREVWKNSLRNDWQDKAIFVVGEATAKAALDKLGLESTGHEAGSAEALVPVILHCKNNCLIHLLPVSIFTGALLTLTCKVHLLSIVVFVISAVRQGHDPLLFPCGNLRRETIPTEMEKAGIPLDSVQVYRTCADLNIEQSLEDLIKKVLILFLHCIYIFSGNSFFTQQLQINDNRFSLGMLSISQGVPSYAVFFSPSGVNFTAEIVSSFTKWWSKVELVAIGKTTEQAMKNKQWTVTAVADQPNPHALAQCIVKSMQCSNTAKGEEK